MPIRELPTLLINQIAAGEVIERPASVVKELVENSLDAGATRIDVAIEDGGHQLIRVSDDGRGIPSDELPLALAPHATSKLERAEQLQAVDTLGFRGEALASVASVSRLRLSSRTPGDEAAHVIEASGPDQSPPAPTGGAPGTIVEVRDLFFNTPARRKFLRAAPTEFGHVNDAVTRLAMMHPNVGFTLTNNGRKTLDLAPADRGADRCIDLLGKDLAEGLLEFEHRDTPTPDPQSPIPTAIWGLAGLPSIARGTTKHLYLAVNGRAVKDRNLIHAVKEAYRGLIPPDRHPLAVVFITMDPRRVDVNVHPAKAEVRFRNPSSIHGLVLSAVRARLIGADLTPSVGFRVSGSGPREERPGDYTLGDASPEPDTRNPEPNAFVDYFRKMDPTQKGFVYEEVKREMAEADEAPIPAAQPALTSDITHQTSHILQVHNSYVVTEDDDGLLIVDQHALHERVMFETLRDRVLGEGKPLESQRLLMPEIVDASPSRVALLGSLKPLLERIGIEAEPIGPGKVAIHAFPSFLFSRNVEAGPFLTELLDKAEEEDLRPGDATAEEAALHEVLDMMACKAAVKAGDRLSPDELSALLAKRGEIERSSNCPHGRPTTLRLTIKDLEKQFGRT